MRYSIRQNGESRSFPLGESFLDGAVVDATAEIAVYLGSPVVADAGKTAVLVELHTECLAQHVDEAAPDSRNVLGFARYRNGALPPSNLVELVRFPSSNDGAVEAAKALLETAGMTVVVCADQPGRILDRLLRPKYNAALRFLEEGLATAKDMDTTCKLGLGYPDGPIERVVNGGLRHHYDVTKALFETYGTAAYAPPRQAVAAARRKEQ
ncbi:MAG: 3-hydroxyacyl-CoA dehydrogenase family protein [Pseudolabrys sp.]|nr:3-hydroxyacyl-CoA dehydrogenase family protein [Pseudolabrys sp.]MDP2293884.1 3-hydroxyacyl-CoA dehydrogenase family protein [Pseudolabrys sp.]